MHYYLRCNLNLTILMFFTGAGPERLDFRSKGKYITYTICYLLAYELYKNFKNSLCTDVCLEGEKKLSIYVL